MNSFICGIFRGVGFASSAGCANALAAETLNALLIVACCIGPAGVARIARRVDVRVVVEGLIVVIDVVQWR